MKYSSYFGIVASLLVIGVCFVPWVFIESINTQVTGMHSGSANFGKAGLMNIFLSVIAMGFFITQNPFAKRFNLFVCTFNFAWAIRNYLVITQCAMGECPQKKWGIYLLVLFTLIMLIFSMLPAAPKNKQ